MSKGSERKYFTRHEVAERLGITAKEVWEMEEAGLIPPAQEIRLRRRSFTVEEFQQIWDEYGKDDTNG